MKQVTFYRSPGEGEGSSGETKDTDNTKLVAVDTVYVSPDGGTTDESFPKQGVDYDFCVDVTNTGNKGSGAFYVRFTLSGDQDPPWSEDFQQDDGLDAGHSVKAVVHFGSFPNEFKSYYLEACIYSPSAPDTPINCAGTFEFAVNTETTDSSGTSDSSGSSDTSGSGDDSSGTGDSSGSSDTATTDDTSSTPEGGSDSADASGDSSSSESADSSGDSGSSSDT